MVVFVAERVFGGGVLGYFVLFAGEAAAQLFVARFAVVRGIEAFALRRGFAFQRLVGFFNIDVAVAIGVFD